MGLKHNEPQRPQPPYLPLPLPVRADAKFSCDLRPPAPEDQGADAETASLSVSLTVWKAANAEFEKLMREDPFIQEKIADFEPGQEALWTLPYVLFNRSVLGLHCPVLIVCCSCLRIQSFSFEFSMCKM